MSASFYVSVPRDGAYGSRVYARSGEMTADLLTAALVRKGARVERARAHQEFPEALEAARSRGATVLIHPTILAWEDRATEWSGKPDKVEVRLEVVDARSGADLDSALLSGQSGLGTLGGDHPQDLLPNPIDKYLDALMSAAPLRP